MSLINFPVFALGSLLVAAPIALHLMMRQKPTHAMFPALRFVRTREVTNQQRLRLRHRSLLVLRCAVLLGLAAALARPVVSSAAAGGWWLVGIAGLLATVSCGLAAVQRQRVGARGLVWTLTMTGAGFAILAIVLLFRLMTQSRFVLPSADGEEPLAVVMVFDTSPRMGLVQDNRSRLDLAKERGRALLKRLPRGSAVAIVDAGQSGEAFAVDRPAAASQMERLVVGHVADSLPRTIERALDLLDTAQQDRRELYVFTDLTVPSWPGLPEAKRLETADDSSARSETRSIEIVRIAERLDAPEATRSTDVYVIDVGSQTPNNLSLGEVQLEQSYLAPGRPLKLRMELFSQGMAASRAVHVLLEKPDPNGPMIVDGKPQLPQRVLRGQREVTIGEGESRTMEFAVRGLSQGVHHGEIRLLGEDGLDIDDTRYFTIQVRALTSILIVPGPGAQPRFVENALAPMALRETGEAVFETKVARPDQLPDVDLDSFAAVVLLDPPALSSLVWRDLRDYVRRGGGLATFLGRNAIPKPGTPFAPEEAQDVLPARLQRVWRAPAGDLSIVMRDNSHPILRVLQQNATAIPWSDFVIERHWSVEPVPDGGHVILRFGNGNPALLERQLGEGRSLLFTAPVSDPMNRSAWTWGTDSWPYLVLVNEIVKYVAIGADAPLNYLVDQVVAFPQKRDDPDRLQLFQPEGVWQEIVARQRRFEITVTDAPGAYRLKNPPPSQRTRGFAVNLSAEATVLDRIATESLDEVFGASRYQLVGDDADIERKIGTARKGFEFYPWMLLVVVTVLALEHLLANRFYGNPVEADSGFRRRVSARESAAKLKESVSVR